MPDRSRTLDVVFGAFLTALVLVALTFAHFGMGVAGTDQALRVTARFSFVLFWPAYAGGIFRRFAIPYLSRLAGLRREFGFGFASAHSVHVLLIAWRYQIGAPASRERLIVDGIGIIWMYVLAVFSIDRMRRLLTPFTLRAVFNIGLEYIAFVFLSDFLFAALTRGRATSPAYLPFTILLLGAAATRWSLGVGGLVKQLAARRLHADVRLTGRTPPAAHS